MKILFFGDIVGKPGRQAIKKILPDLKKRYEPDLVLANAENLAHGKGITKESVKEVLEAGIDYLTLGNHTFAIKGANEILDDKSQPIIRPANWALNVPGRGYEIIKIRSKRILLVNLIGRVFMGAQYDNPFFCIDEILDEYSLGNEDGKEKVSVIIVDWHAEATSEKMVMGWYLDGKVSAVLGTHTHIGTDDWRILPSGTAYVTDIGMVGSRDSILGVDKDIILKRFLTQINYRMEVAGGGPVLVEGVLVDIDEKTGLAQNIEKVKLIINLEIS